MKTRTRGQHAPPTWGRPCRATRAVLARERRGDYDVSPPSVGSSRPVEPPTVEPPCVESPAEAAIARVNAAIADLAAVDWSREDNDMIRAASIGMQRVVSQVSAQALRPLEQLQCREAYGADGAVTAASWLRNRANMDPGTAAQLCTTAHRLRGLPLVRDAFAAGDVTYRHVTAVTDAAVPNRYAAISAVEATLVELARTAKPQSVRKAVAAIRDVVDPDATDPDDDDAATGVTDDDPRRYWNHSKTIDGMSAGSYLVGGVMGELIDMLFDAFSTADPPDTPVNQRRSPAQKRVDAMYAALMALYDAGMAPTVNGNKAHLLLMVDLLTLLGRDKAAVFASELRRTGRVSHATIARLGLNAKVTPVLTMGRYRVVAVGRTYRTLPPWLRPMLEMIHRKCRGPDCDRPACWTQAHHQDAFALGGDTDLNKTIPLCQAHHDLVTHGGWTVTLDNDTGICTWTSPNGRVITTHPDN